MGDRVLPDERANCWSIEHKIRHRWYNCVVILEMRRAVAMPRFPHRCGQSSSRADLISEITDSLSSASSRSAGRPRTVCLGCAQAPTPHARARAAPRRAARRRAAPPTARGRRPGSCAGASRWSRILATRRRSRCCAAPSLYATTPRSTARSGSCPGNWETHVLSTAEHRSLCESQSREEGGGTGSRDPGHGTYPLHFYRRPSIVLTT